MNFEEANRFLNSLIDREKSAKVKYPESLDDFKKTLNDFGNPHKYFPSFIVAGTKGKGSTSLFIAKILNSNGYKTGLFLSPHLVDIRERISIDGKLIGKQEFADLISYIKEKVRNGSYRSVFETLTLMSFLYFKEKKVDVAVFEVGLGGRLDATNVVEPVVSVITEISYDHTHILGRTLKNITKEKMGITREYVPIVSSPQKKIVRDYISGLAKSKVTFVGIDTPVKIKNISLDGTLFSYNGNEYFIKMTGEHQARNAATAIEAVNQSPFKFDYLKTKDALKEVIFPGRFQILKKNPLTILDGAHNKRSIEILTKTYKNVIKEKPVVLFYCLKRKPYKEMIKILSELTENFILAKIGGERAINEEDLILEIKKNRKKFSYFEDVGDAYKFLKKLKPPYLITGSLYLVGKILEIEKWKKENLF